MKYSHVNPDESVRAFLDVGARRAAAMHGETFQLTNEGFDEPGRRLREALETHGVPPERFLRPDVGETIRMRAGE
jgi:hypothetical protein